MRKVKKSLNLSKMGLGCPSNQPWKSPVGHPCDGNHDAGLLIPAQFLQAPADANTPSEAQEAREGVRQAGGATCTREFRTISCFARWGMQHVRWMIRQCHASEAPRLIRGSLKQSEFHTLSYAGRNSSCIARRRRAVVFAPHFGIHGPCYTRGSCFNERPSILAKVLATAWGCSRRILLFLGLSCEKSTDAFTCRIRYPYPVRIYTFSEFKVEKECSSLEESIQLFQKRKVEKQS